MRGRHIRLILFFCSFCLAFLPLCQWAPFRVHPTALVCQLASRVSVIRRTARNQARASVILRETIQLYSIVQSNVSWGKRSEWMTKIFVYMIASTEIWLCRADANLLWGDLWSDPLERIALFDSHVSTLACMFVCCMPLAQQTFDWCCFWIVMQKHSLSQWPRVNNWISCPWLTERDQILCALEMSLLEWMTGPWISRRTCGMLSLLMLFYLLLGGYK